MDTEPVRIRAWHRVCSRARPVKAEAAQAVQDRSVESARGRETWDRSGGDCVVTRQAVQERLVRAEWRR